jgi:hypothetical protein
MAGGPAVKPENTHLGSAAPKGLTAGALRDRPDLGKVGRAPGGSWVPSSVGCAPWTACLIGFESEPDGASARQHLAGGQGHPASAEVAMLLSVSVTSHAVARVWAEGLHG